MQPLRQPATGASRPRQLSYVLRGDAQAEVACRIWDVGAATTRLKLSAEALSFLAKETFGLSRWAAQFGSEPASLQYPLRSTVKKIIAAACLLALPIAHAAQEPEAVFARTCSMCHNGQLPMAPKKGDQAAWKPRLEQGKDLLVKHVTEGYKSMPARGLCRDCSAEDYEEVIAWMSK